MELLTPPGFLTVRETVPAEPAGLTATSWVELTTVTEGDGFVPNVTLAPLAKPVPMTVTAVAPDTGPEVGERLVTVGPVEVYVKAWEMELLNPPGFVTVRETVPAEPAGLTATSWVELTTVTEGDGFVPNVTTALLSKPLPLIVTAVAPDTGPEVGERLVTVGPEEVYVKALEMELLNPPGFVTVRETVPAEPAGLTATR